MEKRKGKILHLHYYFPPVGTVGTLRNYNMALELSKVFESSHLITVKNKPFLMEEHFDLDFIDIHEVEHWDYRVISEKLSRKKDLNDRVNAKRAGRTFGWSRKLLDSYPGNLLWGEGGWIYIKNALKKARTLIAEEGITYIYSSFRPMADHYIAYRLKKEFPHLIWMADFRDLPVDRNRRNVFLSKGQDRRYRQLFHKADFLLTVSKGLRKKLLEYHDQVLVVRNGLRRLFLPEYPVWPDKFTISYTGSLYPKLQDPTALFASLHELLRKGTISPNKIQLIYAGKDHRIWQNWMEDYALEEISVVRGKVSLTESLRLQHESHINILLTWVGPHSGGVLTGKLSEYLASRRPILCLVSGGRDEELEEIADGIAAFSVFTSNEESGIHDKILDGYQSHQKGQLTGENQLTSHGEQFQWENNVQALLSKVLSA